jgi:16S rRNA (adenine1518-N6/adenine1519-N6)-dimethyltransferase
MKLSEMRQLLVERGIQLTKSLGQNFMHDGNQLRRIVEAAELKKSDKVIEVGPGLGPLTELLVEGAGEVLAIEKDARLVEVLRVRFKQGPTEGRAGNEARIEIVHDDALEFLRRDRRSWNEWKLVANLPYSVASPILVELAQAERGPQRMVATLQAEVARRLVAGPGAADYGLLSLLVQLEYEPRASFKVPAGCFFPEPEVDSSCVCLVQRARPLLSVEQSRTFVRIAKRAFSQRRKMMLKLLKEDWSAEALDQGFAALGLARTVRAEMVSLEQFVQMTRLLTM